MRALSPRSPSPARSAALTAVLTVVLVAGCGRDSALVVTTDDAGAGATDGATTTARPDGGGTGVADLSLAGAQDLSINRRDGAVSVADLGVPVDLAPVTLVAVEVTPPLSTLAIGTQATLAATGVYSDGHSADLGATVTWTSDAPMVASVSGGRVSALSAGSATIHAALGAVGGAASITVSPATVTGVAVTPPSAATGIGGTAAFHAVAMLSDGTFQDVTASATWSSSPPSVATISSLGVATGVAAGASTVKATIGVFSATAALTVGGATLLSIALTPTDPTVGIHDTFPFAAVGTYSDGSIADLTGSATFTSAAPSVVSVTAQGVAAALAAGSAVITATVATASGKISGSTTVTVTPATLSSIAVTPGSSTLAPKGTVALHAAGTYSDGSTADLTQSVAWSSSAPAVAGVSNAAGSSGLCTALSPGSATVGAALAGVTGSASVTVVAARLVSIALAPSDGKAPVGTTLPFTAKGTYADGSVIDITALCTWSTDDATIATVDNSAAATGVVSALALGSTKVHAALGGISGSAALTVTAATLASVAVTPAASSLVSGQKQAMTATAVYSDGTRSDVTALCVWTTAAAAVATVSNAQGAQGLLTAVAAGSTTVSAACAGQSGAATVTVADPTLVQLVISPLGPSVLIGARVMFGATAIYSNNTSRNVTMMTTWKSSDPTIATINNNGRADAVAAGTTTITAGYMGLAATSLLTVTAPVLTEIVVSPIDPTYVVGTRQAFTATAIFSDGTSRDVTMLATWSSSDPTVAGITTGGDGGMGMGMGMGMGGPGGRGNLDALSAGSVIVSATFMGLTGTSVVTITDAVVVSISVSPASSSLAAGDTRQLSAQAIYSDSTSRDVTMQATWVSSAPQVAGVGDSMRDQGLVTALAPGSTTITASFSGLSGTAAVTVTAATVTSISVTPDSPSVAVGVPVDFRAVAIFSDNTSMDVTDQATWVSSSPTAAQVSDQMRSKGEAQALPAGTATITASYDGVSGSTVITVSGATLTMIQVTPFAPTIPVGYVTDFVATGLYSDNTTQDLTALATWISGAPASAAVSDSGATKGRVTPQAAGTVTVGASYLGVTGNDTVTVSSATLSAIVITPADPGIAVGASQPFTAGGQLSDGSTLDVTGYVTWLSSAPSVASISNAANSRGDAKALSAGTVTITAVRGSTSGTTTLTVH